MYPHALWNCPNTSSLTHCRISDPGCVGAAYQKGEALANSKTFFTKGNLRVHILRKIKKRVALQPRAGLSQLRPNNVTTTADPRERGST